MNVTSAVREYAVIRICREARADWPGARLQIADFAEAWKQTGLREHDLAEALREMLGAGVFEGRPVAMDSVLTLTAVGAELLEGSTRGFGDLGEMLRVRRTLERARSRAVQAPPPGARNLRRRSSDRATASG